MRLVLDWTNTNLMLRTLTDETSFRNFTTRLVVAWISTVIAYNISIFINFAPCLRHFGSNNKSNCWHLNISLSFPFLFLWLGILLARFLPLLMRLLLLNALWSLVLIRTWARELLELWGQLSDPKILLRPGHMLDVRRLNWPCPLLELGKRGSWILGKLHQGGGGPWNPKPAGLKPKLTLGGGIEEAKRD